MQHEQQLKLYHIRTRSYARPRQSKDGGESGRHSQRRVLTANGAGLIDALERHKRQKASHRQTSDKITRFLDRMISAHLVRNPEQINNLKGDPEIQRIKYSERYPEAGSVFTATSRTHLSKAPWEIWGVQAEKTQTTKKICRKDYLKFTYWLREPEVKAQMQEARAAGQAGDERKLMTLNITGNMVPTRRWTTEQPTMFQLKSRHRQIRIRSTL